MNDRSRPKAAPESAAKTTSTIVAPSTDITTIITVADAERLTTRIQLRLGTIADNIESVLSLIEQARAGNVHEVLGYRSWAAYIADKFGGSLARLTKAERIPVVELLSGQGLSTRTIATVVGADHATVARDVRSGVASATPGPDGEKCHVEGHGWHGNTACSGVPRITTSSLRNLTAEDFLVADATDEKPDAALAEARANEDLSPENVIGIKNKTTTRNVTGTDGKSYPARPVGSPTPRRRPLPDSYRDAAWKTVQLVENLARWHRDDRFASNRETLKNYGPELGRAANKLLDLLDDLGIDRDKCGGIR